MHTCRAMLRPSRVAALLLLATCISTRASDVPRPKLRVPPALVINLPRDAERFAGVKKQMDDQGVYFERIDAVNGRALSESERRANATAAVAKTLRVRFCGAGAEGVHRLRLGGDEATLEVELLS